MLEEYSKKFSSVEVDQWFWSLHSENKISLPRKNDVLLYNKSVDENFRFTIKVPNSITLTHFYKKSNSDSLKVNPHFLSTDLFNTFLSTIEPMKSKISVLMFQFEYLNKDKMKNQFEFQKRFEEFLQILKTDYKLGIEIRNPNYLNNTFFEFLKKNHLSMVFLQGYYMPPIWKYFEKAKQFLSSPVVIRLHGADRSGIEQKTGNLWNQIVEPKDEELKSISEIIIYLAKKQIDVYINVNNHYEGCAPLTIKKMQTLLADFNAKI